MSDSKRDQTPKPSDRLSNLSPPDDFINILDEHDRAIEQLKAAVRGDGGANCHHCGHYETNGKWTRETLAHCPSCGRHTTWIAPVDPVPPSEEAVQVCECTVSMSSDSTTCLKCGRPLQKESEPSTPPGDALEMLYELRAEICSSYGDASKGGHYGHKFGPVLKAIEAERARTDSREVQLLQRVARANDQLAAEKRAHASTVEKLDDAQRTIRAACRAIRSRHDDESPLMKLCTEICNELSDVTALEGTDR